MSRIAIYGAGGFGKEARMLLEILSGRNGKLSFAGFVDDFVKKEPMAVKGQYEDVILAVADPDIRRSLYEKLSSLDYGFQKLVHPDVFLDRSITMGKGSIVCAGVLMTVDISIGEFVIVNLGTTIGHDVSIGDFSSIMPSVNISGGVTIGKNVFIGSGATILQGLSIGDHAIIGAGTVVIRSVEAGMKVVGSPARAI